ncbi:MAG: BMC domain-containing protein [Eubacterium sp.]|nr:BMC domain-containing protein [Eubacterium sp.]
MAVYGALGLVEVLGSANGVLVLDRMCKTSGVKYEARYTRNGGHDTVVVSGEISAVQAAVDSVRENPPCEIIAAAVISGPADETARIIADWSEGKM